MTTMTIDGRPRSARARCCGPCFLVMFLAWSVLAVPASAQVPTDTARTGTVRRATPVAGTDSVEVVAGSRYAAGPITRFFFGDDYRRLWTTPMRVPVLDLGSFAGGLTPHERGGGKQTKVLHMRGPEGREWVFRSVDKEPALADEPALQNTIVSGIVQDQVSSLHPAAALIVPPLLEAVGIMHPVPVLTVMPDDPRLGEFREEFAGLLGWIEERPDEIAAEDGDRPGFGGFARITGTERLLERLEESAEHRADARAYLTARLMDLLIGDWDRHADQWRWAEEDGEGDPQIWVPIPRDRDYAMVRYDGAAMAVAAQGISNLVVFGPDIDVDALTLNARDLDRRLLSELSLAAWDSITSFVQARITDEVIDSAFARIPREYRSADARAPGWLKARRDALGDAARRFYLRLASHVDIRATGAADIAIIERLADGVVRVSLHEREDGAHEPRGTAYYSRTFYTPETDEVRVYLLGGDDYAVVRGDVRRTPRVRVIGGEGDDELADSSRVLVSRGATRFYDAEGHNTLLPGWGTQIQRRPYIAPEYEWRVSGEQFRDWGESRGLTPAVDYQGPDGLVIGAGPVYTKYGFRSVPYAYRVGMLARLGLGSLKPSLEIFGDVRRENSPWGYWFSAEASRLENFRFFGFGNDTGRSDDFDDHLVLQDRITLRAGVDRWDTTGVRLRAGPVVMYSNPDVADDSPIGELPRYGNRGFGQAGVEGMVELDRRRGGEFADAGYRVEVGAEYFPSVWSVRDPFGSIGGRASSYLTPRGVPATLALRVGGDLAWGEFPVHESAFLGGSRSIRGYTFQRYAGDRAVFGNAELRVPITTAVLLVRGTLGALALADAGRLWFDGASDGGWHTAAGGGLWFEFELRDTFLGVTAFYARGDEDGRFYLKFGAPF